jgi:hypothetical protein
MAEKAKIKLGGQTYTVRPLTLGQIREIAIASATLFTPGGTSREREAQAMDMMIEAVSAGLRRDAPEVAANILEVETTMQELTEAYRTVQRLAGLFVPNEDAAPGEAQAAA